MNARKIAALRAMAEQSESPEEAAIARAKLAALETRDPTVRDPREPCGICGKFPRAHGPRPTNEMFVLLMGWHEYRPEWEIAWANYQEHERIGDALARQAEDRQIAEMVKRWEHGTYRGMTVRADGNGPRIGKA